MSELHNEYLKGARQLCKETRLNPVDHEAASILHIRLKGISSQAIYGHNSDKNAEQTEILGLLNEITERLFGIQFVDYCQPEPLQQVLHGKDEDVGRDNSPLPQNVTGMLILREGNIELHAQESNLEKQAYDFLISADAYIATLLPRVQNARKAFDNAKLRPQECVDAYEPLYTFFHSCIPSYDLKLFEMRVRLDYLNDQILEVTKLFREFCLEAQKTGKHTSKTQRGLDILLTTLQTNAEFAQYFIISVKQEKIGPNKNTSLDEIS